jgi:hypothetical protein
MVSGRELYAAERALTLWLFRLLALESTLVEGAMVGRGVVALRHEVAHDEHRHVGVAREPLQFLDLGRVLDRDFLVRDSLPEEKHFRLIAVVGGGVSRHSTLPFLSTHG